MTDSECYIAVTIIMVIFLCLTFGFLSWYTIKINMDEAALKVTIDSERCYHIATLMKNDHVLIQIIEAIEPDIAGEFQDPLWEIKQQLKQNKVDHSNLTHRRKK